jgi:hypothetical protein
LPNITPRRTATAALLIAAGLTQAPEARAAGVPVQLKVVDNAKGTGFSLSGPTDVAQFTFKAAAGQDLFLGLERWYDLQAEILDPSGKPFKTYDAAAGSSDLTEEGVELHPRVGGTYTVRVRGGDYIQYPYTDPTIWVYPDCRGGPATKCAIAPGQTAKATFGGSNDDDAYVVKAPAGKRYTATLQVANRDETLYFSEIRLVDGKGEVVQSQLTGAGPAKRNKAIMKFVLPASGGPFFLQANPHPASSYNYRGTFTLSLQQQ